jgi:hypothetical protein
MFMNLRHHITTFLLLEPWPLFEIPEKSNRSANSKCRGCKSQPYTPSVRNYPAFYVWSKSNFSTNSECRGCKSQPLCGSHYRWMPSTRSAAWMIACGWHRQAPSGGHAAWEILYCTWYPLGRYCHFFNVIIFPCDILVFPDFPCDSFVLEDQHSNGSVRLVFFTLLIH